MDEKLKPCPFCGDEAELTRGKDTEWGKSWREQWVACCKGNVDADCFGVREPTYFSAAFARSMWNRRTPEQAE